MKIIEVLMPKNQQDEPEYGKNQSSDIIIFHDALID